MTFNAKTRVFYNRAIKKQVENVIFHLLVKWLVIRVNFNNKQISIDNRVNNF